MFIYFMTVARAVRRAVESSGRRSDRAEAEARAGRDHLRTPADNFHDTTWLPLCTQAAAAASGLLKRPLTHEERQALWKARSPLVLEVLIKELAGKPSPGEAAALLRTLPSGLDRPDPTGWIAAAASPPAPPI
jgi:hypothetical protein